MEVARAHLSTIAAITAVAALWATSAHAQDEALTLTLAQAIGQAKTRAPDAQVAIARLEEAEAMTSQARAGHYPTVSVGGRAGANGVADRLPQAGTRYVLYSNEAEGFAAVTLNLLDFGKTSSAVEAAEHTQAGAAASRDVAIQTVARLTAEAYITALFDDALIDVAKVTMKTRGRHAAIARGMVAAGVRPAIDELRARVAVDQAKGAVLAAEATAEISHARLATLVFLDPAREVRVKRIVLPTLDAAPAHDARTAEGRPEIAAAREEARSADATADAAHAQRRPTISVRGEGSIGVKRYDYIDAFWSAARGSGVVSLSIPLFDPAIGSRIDAAEARRAVSRARVVATMTTLKSQAYESAIAFRSAKALFADAQRVAEGAGAALAVIEARYTSGLASPADLGDAEAMDAQARANTIQAERQLALATVRHLASTNRLASLESR